MCNFKGQQVSLIHLKRFMILRPNILIELKLLPKPVPIQLSH